MSNLPAIPQAANPVLKILESPMSIAELRKVCAANLSPERLLRMILTTAKQKVDIQNCSAVSVMRVAMQCAQYGIEPDGRHAHLIPFKGELTLLIDWKGLVALGRRGGVQGIAAELVYANDRFDLMRDEKGLHFRHEPEFRGEPGDLIGSYCFFIVDGVPDLEFMTVSQIEAVRNKSRNADGEFWTNHYGEMCRKTTIRRASKRWPLEAEVADLVATDPGDRTTVTAEPAIVSSNIAPATAALFNRPTQALNPAQPRTAPVPQPQPEPEKVANVAQVETVAPAPAAPATQPVRPRGRPRAATAAPVPPHNAAPAPEPVTVPAPTPAPVPAPAAMPVAPAPETKAQHPSGLVAHLVSLDAALKERGIPREALVEAMIAGELISPNTRFEFLAEEDVSQIVPEQLDALAASLAPADDVAS